MFSGRKKKMFSVNRRSIYRHIFSAAICLGIFSFFSVLFFIHDMPDLNNLESKGRRASIIFESYDGQTIATYGDLFRNVVDVDKLPKHAYEAIIAIEDRRFLHHKGVDFIGIMRAMFVNISSGRIVQGGSTLTQQLAKNLFLSHSKSVKRKIQEFILAIWLERKFNKKQILSIYLNRVYFGSGAYGLDAAAYRFFGKSAFQLSVYEAAKIAGALKSPSLYSPFHNPEKSDQRTEQVLICMIEAGYLSENEKKEAMLEKDRLKHLSVPMDENRYFTDWVLEEIQEFIATNNEDLIVRTTLDSKMQKNATYIIRNVLQEHGFRNSVTQMALVALDKTGAVRAMVGGHTYSTSQFNRALALRSFGSAFKYFVFLSALEKGIGIDDHISDMPLFIGSWSPKNYHYSSIGSIPVIDAFVKSINTSTVRLAQKVGMDAIVDKANILGISSNIRKNYASALGASGVNLLEMVSAYGATMNDGIKMVPFGIISIRNQRGKFLYRAYKQKESRVISEACCKSMKIMMRQIMEVGTGKRANLPIPCYGKTGTSNDSRDASFIGFAPPIVAGVWVGNDDNTPMNQKITGGTLPAMTWKEFMLSTFGYKQDATKVQIVNNFSSDKQGIASIQRPKRKNNLKSFINAL